MNWFPMCCIYVFQMEDELWKYKRSLVPPGRNPVTPRRLSFVMLLYCCGAQASVNIRPGSPCWRKSCSDDVEGVKCASMDHMEWCFGRVCITIKTHGHLVHLHQWWKETVKDAPNPKIFARSSLTSFFLDLATNALSITIHSMLIVHLNSLLAG